MVRLLLEDQAIYVRIPKVGVLVVPSLFAPRLQPADGTIVTVLANQAREVAEAIDRVLSRGPGAFSDDVYLPLGPADVKLTAIQVPFVYGPDAEGQVTYEPGYLQIDLGLNWTPEIIVVPDVDGLNALSEAIRSIPRYRAALNVRGGLTEEQAVLEHLGTGNSIGLASVQADVSKENVSLLRYPEMLFDGEETVVGLGDPELVADYSITTRAEL